MHSLQTKYIMIINAAKLHTMKSQNATREEKKETLSTFKQSCTKTLCTHCKEQLSKGSVRVLTCHIDEDNQRSRWWIQHLVQPILRTRQSWAGWACSLYLVNLLILSACLVPLHLSTSSRVNETMSLLVVFASPAFIHASWGDVPPFSLEIPLLLHYSQSLPLRWVGLNTFSTSCVDL